MNRDSVKIRVEQFKKIQIVLNAKNSMTPSHLRYVKPDNFDLNLELLETYETLKRHGYCVLEFDEIDSIQEDKAITYFSYFLKLIGLPIIVFQNSQLLWRKIGVDLLKDPQSSEGVGNSPLHIDFVNSTNPPDLVGLLCIRPDKNKGGKSLVANIKDAINKLDEKDINELSKPIYKNGAFKNLINIGEEFSPFPIVQGYDDGFIRFTEKLGNTKYPEVTNLAIQNLCHTLYKNLIEIPLNQFQLLLLDQRLVVHGKTELIGNQTQIKADKRRELLQIFIRTI